MLQAFTKRFCLLTVVMLLSVVNALADDADVITISTVDELKDFRDKVNAGHSYEGKTVKLTADLDLSSESNWTPIGNVTSYPTISFHGTFDGDGHSISNVTVNDNTSVWACAGLFGSLYDGTIKNLTVKNINLRSTHFAGGIVAYMSDKKPTTVENCHVIGGTITSTPEIVAGSYDNGDKVGGIVGCTAAFSTINNCTVEDVTITAYRDMGGIVGYSDGTVTNNTVINVKVIQDLTNGYKNPTPTTYGDIIGRSDGSPTLSNNKVVEKTYVAQIGTVKYETLEAAFAAAQDGQTITLLANCTGNGIKAPQGKFTTGLTVDFAGFTYTMDGEMVGSTGTETQAFQLLMNNNITFKNGTITSEKAKILVQNYSNLTLEGMTLTLNNANYTNGYTLSNNNGNIVIDGSTINANPAGGFAFDVCRYSSYPSVNVVVQGASVINGNIEIYASNSDAKDGFGLQLTAGTLDGNIVLDASAAAAMAAAPAKVNITKAANFAAAAPEGYEWNTAGKLVEKTYVAQIDKVKYETLQAAFNAAKNGDIVTLLGNYDATGETNTYETLRNLCVISSITIDGKGHTLTVNKRGVAVKGLSSMVDVTFKDINIVNTASSARCIDTRGKIASLTLDHVTLNTQGATSKDIQPLTIGGNQSEIANVIVKNGSVIQTNDDGKAYYAIITFNPVNMTIEDSTIKGWACIYAKGKVSSAGSAGSTFTINRSTLVSSNDYSGVSNAFAAFVMEDNDVTVNVTNSKITLNNTGNNTGDQPQAIAAAKGFTGAVVNLGEGNDVEFVEPGDFAFALNDAEVKVSGGTYNVDPTEYVVDGYKAVAENDKWTVGKVVLGELKEKEGTTPSETAATYTVDVTVKDGEDVLDTKTAQTVTVSIVTEADNNKKVTSDAQISKLDMPKVVAKAIAEAAAAATEINVSIAVVAEESEEPAQVEKTYTYEVYPQATVTVNDETPSTVKLANSDLDKDASFTFTLDVTGKFDEGATIKVVHTSAGYPDEIFYKTVPKDKKVSITVSHFSAFELSEFVTANISALGFATFSSDRALDFSKITTIHAYTAEVNGDRMEFTRIKMVPANTGLLLRNPNGGEVSANVPVLKSDDEVENTVIEENALNNNALVAVTVEDKASLPSSDEKYYYYILNNVNGVGFYRAAGQSVAKGRAYLQVSISTSPVQSFTNLFDGETTAIDSITTTDEQTQDKVFYDLSGRRVSNPQRGLYIVNGKKVLVK